jgi:hypothetical protein
MATSLPPLFPIILYRKRNIKIARVGLGPWQRIFFMFLSAAGGSIFSFTYLSITYEKNFARGVEATFCQTFYSAFERHSFMLIL